MKKKFILIILILIMVVCLSGCDANVTASQKEKTDTLKIGNMLSKNQPTPTDIDYSLERYNLIKRTYWVNGQREKANTLVCEIEKPLGYIILFTESGAIINQFIVDGKVSSLNSYLTPDSEYYEKNTTYRSGLDSNEEYDSYDYSNAERYSNKWIPDVDGSYGENDSGIFFFTVDGKYIEWTGTYLYSDIPFVIENPIVKVKGE